MIDGDVMFEAWERSMYATDASAYEVLPVCVVLPRSTLDVVNVVRYCQEHNISVIARGGGSGLAGQAIGSGVIIDFSKYMNQIVEINPTDGYVITQPGIYKGRLDKELSNVGMYLPPDPSSSNYCTIGGMIANNASGPHTVKYGSILEYVVSLDVVLSNGELIHTDVHDFDINNSKADVGNTGTLASRIYFATRLIVTQNQDLIQQMRPNVSKNSSGYRLERILENGSIDLSKLFVSSEGTLGIIVGARFRIIAKPTSRSLAMISFDKLSKMGQAVPDILSTHPAAVELLDRRILQLSSSDHPEIEILLAKDMEALLLVEFDGFQKTDVERGLVDLKRLAQKKGWATELVVTQDQTEMSRLWDLRKNALPYAQRMRAEGRRAAAFVEDTIVEPSRLGTYLSKLYGIFQKYDVDSVVYGHAGDGHVHTRPLLDPKDADDLRKMDLIAGEVFGLVMKYKGSISGEHGDGMVRAPYVKRLYGDEVYRLFKEIKTVCDPAGILNPGKKLSDDVELPSKQMRYGPDYGRRKSETSLNWAISGSKVVTKVTGYSKELDYGSAIELCHGCGACRETSYASRMCPVYKAGKDEVDSCRGRNNLLRWMMKVGGLTQEVEFTREYGEAIYQHCIQCKMCHIDCPSNVDVGKLMAEARAQYAAVRGLPRGYKYLMNIDKYGELGCKLVPISNWILRNRVARRCIEVATGIDRHRRIPPFAKRTFMDMFREQEGQISRIPQKNDVVFFCDTYLNYNDPARAMALVQILSRNGIGVLVPPQLSSGMPALVEGAPALGKRIAEFNVANLAPLVKQGMPVVTMSPSAGLTLKMEYLNVLDTEESRLVAENTYDMHEFLFDILQRGELLDLAPVHMDALVHLHCHHLVQGIEGKVLGLLRSIPELNIKTIEKGCCGVGGSFSFIKGNLQKSLKMGEELFDEVRATSLPIFSTGESCALQMAQGSGRTIGLTVDLLADACGLHLSG